MTDEENGSKNCLCMAGRNISQILSEMEEKKENRRVIFGSIEGPFFSRATFSCMVRVGFEDESR
jgi:predicted SpoU family rRNA methylase